MITKNRIIKKQRGYMKRLLILAIALLLLSGCVGQKTVKIGDNANALPKGEPNSEFVEIPFALICE